VGERERAGQVGIVLRETPALLERDEQSDALAGWYRDAAAGNSRIVFVGGEAGIGKSSLVEQAIATIDGHPRVLRGVCDMLSTPRPLGPIHDMAAEIGGAFARLVTAGDDREQIFQALLHELRDGPVPTIALIEDAHWADDATLDVLRFIGRRLDRARVLVLVTYRDDEMPPDHPLRTVMGDLGASPAVRRLSVPPLTQRALGGLLRRTTDARFDAELLARLTGGNPFYVTEVLAGTDGPADGVPETVRDAVLARASRLPADARAALDAAAAIGSTMALPVLLSVAGAPPEAVDRCLASGMLVAGNGATVAFRHDLARAAIYDAIPSARRMALHQWALDALDTSGNGPVDPAELAHHAEAAGNAAAAHRFALAAAEQARALHTHRETAAQLARALRFGSDQPTRERAALLEAAAHEHYLVGQVETAIDLQEQALAIWTLHGDRLRVGDAYRRIARICWLAGRNEDGRRACARAVAELEQLGPGPELAAALSTLAQLYMLASETDDAIATGERAIALATEVGDVESRIHALNSVGSARLHIDDPLGWEEIELSLRLAREAGLEEHIGRGYMNLAWNAVHWRLLARAQAILGEGLAYTTEHDLDASRLYMLSCSSFVHVLTGDWDLALRDAASVLDSARSVAGGRITALTVRGLVLARRKQDGAIPALEEALALAEATGEVQRLRPVRIALAEAAWLSGDLASAAAQAQAVLDLTITYGSAWGLGDVLVWLKRAGVDSPDLAGTTLPRIAVPYARALAGDWAGAAEFWQERDCSYDGALALLDGDEAAVRDAHAIFTRFGADAAVDASVRRLRELGARRIPRGPRPATRMNPANLTLREQDVVPLLTAGLSTNDIAAQLFLSSKTVEHHISRIYRKLGVSSRAEALAAIARLDAAK
jgi:DNA-binding CsgD family transcriptional regulator